MESSRHDHADADRDAPRMGESARRRLPMVEVTTPYTFDAEAGATLLELFDEVAF
jgi:predicted dithiol-disulfide oxidoreductase (DUF899 family)